MEYKKKKKDMVKVIKNGEEIKILREVLQAHLDHGWELAEEK